MVIGGSQISNTVHYCSYFDHRYMARALCLYDSLQAHSPDFCWHVLALSDACEKMLNQLRLPRLEVVSLAKLEEAMPELLEAKANRSVVEYYFTLTSAFCLFLMPRVPQSGWLTYLDSDLYFFESPQPIFDEMEDASVGIIEHRFTEPNRAMIKHGRFNVGWVSFRQDQEGMRCLQDWNRRCLEWCYDRLEGDRFADQKYLDRWPDDFARVRIIQHSGVNIGPWNVADFVRARQGRLSIDNTGILFAHFQGVRYLGMRTYEIAMDAYAIDAELRRPILQNIYRPYLKKLFAKQKLLSRIQLQGCEHADQELRAPKKLIPWHNFSELIRFPKRYVFMTRRSCWVTV
jgi:hypothetical protein